LLCRKAVASRDENASRGEDEQVFAMALRSSLASHCDREKDRFFKPLTEPACPVEASFVFAKMRAFSNLKVLHVYGSLVTPRSVRLLRKLGLESLSFRHCDFKDPNEYVDAHHPSTTHLTGFTSLRRLELTFSQTRRLDYRTFRLPRGLVELEVFFVGHARPGGYVSIDATDCGCLQTV
jgi:hypothetical protein